MVEGGAADSVIEAIRTVKDVDNIETITIKDANLDTHVESWVRSVLLVEGRAGRFAAKELSCYERSGTRHAPAADESAAPTSPSTVTIRIPCR